jgi:hypothetical protein
MPREMIPGLLIQLPKQSRKPASDRPGDPSWPVQPAIRADKPFKKNRDVSMT